MMTITAYYGTRRGGSGARHVRSAKEAEKIMRGAYGVTTVRMIDMDGTVVGTRHKGDAENAGRWIWWFDPDVFNA